MFWGRADNQNAILCFVAKEPAIGMLFHAFGEELAIGVLFYALGKELAMRMLSYGLGGVGDDQNAIL